MIASLATELPCESYSGGIPARLDFRAKRRAFERMQRNTRLLICNELNTSGSTTWPMYRSDPREYLRHGGAGWQSRVTDFVTSLRSRNEPVVYVDICGTADGAKIGATRSFSFALRIPRNIEERADRVFVEGDIFSRSDFHRIVTRLSHDGHYPALVTFEPYGGLIDHPGIYSPEVSWNGLAVGREKTLLSYARLAKNLECMIQVIRPGGFIFIGFFEMSYMLRSDGEAMRATLARIARCAKCSLEVGTNRYLICKNP